MIFFYCNLFQFLLLVRRIIAQIHFLKLLDFCRFFLPRYLSDHLSKIFTLYTLKPSTILSKQLYRSLSISTTCSGELCEHKEVKPTISEKKIVTESKLSATTGCWFFRRFATDLKKKHNVWFEENNKKKYNRIQGALPSTHPSQWNSCISITRQTYSGNIL